ncbi:MAG: ABC transporter substrate-binding protein [Thiomargarita sp.]|nr:ABC transporter substrate-binding protein [Thiomargarita sp.]
MKCDSCKIWIPAIILILLSLVFAYQFVEPPPSKEINIATGREGGGYHQFALKYQKLLAEEKISLDIVPTAGSMEVLEQLKAGNVSIGLVQGGVKTAEFGEGLQSLASLFYEPLWVFHRKEISPNYLFDLRGKRLAIGEKGSGTRALVLPLLRDNKVNVDNSTFLDISSKNAAEKLMAGEIDAAFFVTSPTASIITKLLNHVDIDLLHFRRHTAYEQRYSFLTSVKIGEGMIDLENNIPHEDKILLATTASLIARNDLHPDIAHLLLTKLIILGKIGGLLEKPKEFPSTKFSEFPVNEEAEYFLKNGPNFLQKIFPFWVASTLDRLKIMLIPLIAIIIPLLKGALPIYRWRIRFKIFRMYGILRELDVKINNTSSLNEIEEDTKQIKALQKEIIEQIKVPLSYMGEFYDFQMHIQLILTRLEERRKEILSQSI